MVLPEDQIAELLFVYRTAFGSLDELSPAKQSMSDEEFRSEMRTPSVTKYMSRNQDGRVRALACVTTDPARVPWLSPAYYRKRFPDQFARGAMFYIGTVLSDPAQGGKWALTGLFKAIGADVYSALGVAVLDCCRHNVEVLRIPDAVTAAAGRFGEFERYELDVQRYFAFVALKPKLER
jgi:hypothetical protein